jgi:hypothetical protein
MRAIAALITLLIASPAFPQGEPARATENLWNEREAQRFANQRRDCQAQWAGFAKTAKTGDQSKTGSQKEEEFIEDCVTAARIARCHPPGSNPTCLYLSRQKRAERN